MSRKTNGITETKEAIRTARMALETANEALQGLALDSYVLMRQGRLTDAWLVSNAAALAIEIGSLCGSPLLEDPTEVNVLNWTLQLKRDGLLDEVPGMEVV